ncbi:MAG TPA: Hpt domain-containing protein [Rhizomicrobium sp.]|jgi:chemotaxis protein histidine kinase CheA|nr:Hpt domain-containing protein [Rhizomicrobium sp.]
MTLKPNLLADMTITPVSAYPQPVSGIVKTQLRHALSSRETLKAAEKVMQEKSGDMREAVLSYVAKLEAAKNSGDAGLLFAQAHEIRGLAANAGLVSAGRIADGLCRYLDEAGRREATVDRAVTSLFVDAVSRASHATDDATKLGDTVARELNALAARKLAG